MKMLPSARLVASRWLDLFARLIRRSRAAYAADGIRGVAFYLKVYALSAHALLMGAPVILGEIVSATIERENLIAAYRAGVSPEHYVREKCASFGVAVGSPIYMAVLSWAWSLVNYFESKGLI